MVVAATTRTSLVCNDILERNWYLFSLILSNFFHFFLLPFGFFSSPRMESKFEKWNKYFLIFSTRTARSMLLVAQSAKLSPIERTKTIANRIASGFPIHIEKYVLNILAAEWLLTVHGDMEVPLSLKITPDIFVGYFVCESQRREWNARLAIRVQWNLLNAKINKWSSTNKNKYFQMINFQWAKRPK